MIGVGLVGCKQTGDGTRNVVEVLSINDNQPLISDVYNFGANPDPTVRVDDFIPIDVVEVTFLSRVHDPNLNTVQSGLPFGSVTFNSYDVVYTGGPIPNANGADLDGDGSCDLCNFSAPMNTYVPTDFAGTGYVLVVSGADKATEPIVCLGPNFGGLPCVGITDIEYAANAVFTFHGVEETSGDAITVERGMLIRIGQFGDD
jgi:hypothetical protein